jgi:DnaK suppressor protein
MAVKGVKVGKKVEAGTEEKSKPDKPPGKRDLERYRKMLTEMLLATEKKSMAPVGSIYGADPGDQARLESDMSDLVNSKNKARAKIPEIRAALKRLTDGEFGICEDCGEPIPLKRLDANPITELCIGCQTAKEKEEQRRTGRRGVFTENLV